MAVFMFYKDLDLIATFFLQKEKAKTESLLYVIIYPRLLLISQSIEDKDFQFLS